MLTRAVCLALVLATGIAGFALAHHMDVHGSHCIAVSNSELSLPHDHSAGDHNVATDMGTEEQTCVQHSCVAVSSPFAAFGLRQNLRPHAVQLGEALLLSSLSAESLHRPPIL